MFTIKEFVLPNMSEAIEIGAYLNGDVYKDFPVEFNILVSTQIAEELLDDTSDGYKRFLEFISPKLGAYVENVKMWIEKSQTVGRLFQVGRAHFAATQPLRVVVEIDSPVDGRHPDDYRNPREEIAYAADEAIRQCDKVIGFFGTIISNGCTTDVSRVKIDFEKLIETESLSLADSNVEQYLKEFPKWIEQLYSVCDMAAQIAFLKTIGALDDVACTINADVKTKMQLLPDVATCTGLSVESIEVSSDNPRSLDVTISGAKGACASTAISATLATHFDVNVTAFTPVPNTEDILRMTVATTCQFLNDDVASCEATGVCFMINETTCIDKCGYGIYPCGHHKPSAGSIAAMHATHSSLVSVESVYFAYCGGTRFQFVQCYCASNSTAPFQLIEGTSHFIHGLWMCPPIDDSDCENVLINVNHGREMYVENKTFALNRFFSWECPDSIRPTSSMSSWTLDNTWRYVDNEAFA